MRMGNGDGMGDEWTGAAGRAWGATEERGMGGSSRAAELFGGGPAASWYCSPSPSASC